jgi:hypothetical protein
MSSDASGLRAARALLEVRTAVAWSRAVAGILDDKADFTEALQASTWIHAACARVADRCFVEPFTAHPVVFFARYGVIMRRTIVVVALLVLLSESS